MRFLNTTALALVAVVTTASNVALPPRNSSTPLIGFVDVSVSTVWTNPTKPRAIDKPVLTNPVHIEEWLDSMTLEESRDLTDSSRTQTQALYGTRVAILDHQDGWYKVAVSGQPTPKNSYGYPGWVPECQVTFDNEYNKLQSSRPFAAVDKVGLATLYRDVWLKEPFLNITYNTRLPVLVPSAEAIQVAVPGGLPAYVSASEATVYGSVSDIPYPTGEDLVQSAQLFYGHPYLWGGTSGYAFDCSGFTHTLYDAHGITISRDADAQADFTGHGARVDRADLQVGDLIFYADNLSDPSTIYHVAMFAGDSKMVEAYASGTPVRITTVRFTEDYWGAERFLTH